MKKNKKTPQKGSFLTLWWRGAESNRRHKDFQSFALPTELPSQDDKVITYK